MGGEEPAGRANEAVDDAWWSSGVQLYLFRGEWLCGCPSCPIQVHSVGRCIWILAPRRLHALGVPHTHARRFSVCPAPRPRARPPSRLSTSTATSATVRASTRPKSGLVRPSLREMAALLRARSLGAPWPTRLGHRIRLARPALARPIASQFGLGVPSSASSLLLRPESASSCVSLPSRNWGSQVSPRQPEPCRTTQARSLSAFRARGSRLIQSLGTGHTTAVARPHPSRQRWDC